MKLNIWIEWEGASSPSEGYFTQAVGSEPAHGSGMLGHGPGKQAAGMLLSSQLDHRPANLAEGAALPSARRSPPASLISSLPLNDHPRFCTHKLSTSRNGNGLGPGLHTKEGLQSRSDSGLLRAGPTPFLRCGGLLLNDNIQHEHTVLWGGRKGMGLGNRRAHPLSVL